MIDIWVRLGFVVGRVVFFRMLSGSFGFCLFDVRIIIFFFSCDN